MLLIAVHVVANQLKVEAGSADLFQPQVERVVIRIALIAFVDRIGFGFVGWRESVNPGIEAREAKIHIVEAAAGAVVLNVLPVELVAGGVGAAVALTGPEGHFRREVEVGQFGETFAELHIMPVVILTVPVGGAFRLMGNVGLDFSHHAAVRG